MSKTSRIDAGVPAYKPPENGFEELSGAADIFAFGGVLVFLFGEQHVHPLNELNDNGISRRMIECYDKKSVLEVPELQTIEHRKLREMATECLRAEWESRPSASDLLERLWELSGVRESDRMGQEAQDALVKVQMGAIERLMKEVDRLTAKMQEKDMEIGDLDIQLDFLMTKYMDSI